MIGGYAIKIREVYPRAPPTGFNSWNSTRQLTIGISYRRTYENMA